MNREANDERSLPWRERYRRGQRAEPLKRGALKLPSPSNQEGQLGTDEALYLLFAFRQDVGERLAALLASHDCEPDKVGWRKLAVALAMKHHPAFQIAPLDERSENPKASEHFFRDTTIEMYLTPPPGTKLAEGKEFRTVAEAARLTHARLKQLASSAREPSSSIPSAKSIEKDYHRRRKQAQAANDYLGLQGRWPNFTHNLLHVSEALSLLTDVAKRLTKAVR